ncbi:hypothetical protein LguiA_023099 [Lonicera macranthoides]
METTTHRQKNGSRDKFSFPIIDEFEFTSTTPNSPNSPADHLFFNGILLPHTFPSQPTNPSTFYSRSTSRTSSVSSKDSLLSSRSNSYNSRSSSCSSARSSISEGSWEQRKKTGERNRGGGQFGYSSKRWQFIAPAPVLSQQVSRRRNGGSGVGEVRVKGGGGGGEEKRGWWGRRFFRSFLSACRECHAIEPARRKRGVIQVL